MTMLDKAPPIQWEDWPRQVSASTYRSVRDRYVEVVCRCPDVVAVFQIGEISVPGLSDIDIVVVVNEELRESSPVTYAVSSDETAQYCFDHTPYVIPSGVFTNIERFWWTQKLTHLAGTDLSPRLLDGRTKELVGLSLVIDYVPLLSSVVRTALEYRVIPVRKMLAILNAVRHSFRLLEPFERADEWVELGDRVVALRREFFTRDAVVWEGPLLELMVAVERCMTEVMARLDAVLQSDAFFGPLESTCALLEVSPTTWYRFTPDWIANGRGSFRYSGGLPQRLAARVSSLPPGLLPVYQEYALGGGPLSERLRSGLKVEKPIVRNCPSQFENVLREKMRWANRQAFFLQRHGFSWGQMALFPFYRPVRVFRGILEQAVAGFHRRRLQRWR